MATAYVPPHRRAGNTAVPTAMPANVTSVSTMLVTMGWTAGAGGSFYLPANHPHIHITANGAAAYVATASVYAGVTMVAISDGQQGNGGGGTTFYPAANAASQTRRTAARALLDAAALTQLDAVLAALP
jgi:hypothetical protein